MEKKNRQTLRDLLASIATQATEAKRFKPEDDQLCDALDDLDNSVQDVIAFVNRLRSEEGGDA